MATTNKGLAASDKSGSSASSLAKSNNASTAAGTTDFNARLQEQLKKNKENRQKEKKGKYFKPAPNGAYKLQVVKVLGQIERDLTDENGKVTKTIYPYRYTFFDHDDLESGIRFYDAPSTVSQGIDDGIEYNNSMVFLLRRKGASQMDTKYTVTSLSRDQELDVSTLNLKDHTIETDNKDGNGSVKGEA